MKYIRLEKEKIKKLKLHRVMFLPALALFVKDSSNLGSLLIKSWEVDVSAASHA